MAERGRIANRAAALQGRDFTGLRFGNITPTDLDAFIDLGEKGFIFIEAKAGDTPLPYGQRLALERLCDATRRGGIPSIVIIAAHRDAGDIDFARAVVREFRVGGRWLRGPKPSVTVREMCDEFARLYWKAA